MANEKRLIDANDAEQYAREHILDANERYTILDFLRECATVDAVEVVHAHWDNNGICTLCGYPIPTDSKYDFIDKDDCLFCYHCGAKMDGDGNG